MKDGYSFHLLIPAGVSTLQAGFSYIFGMAGMSMYNDASAKLLMLRWNHVVLYPAGVRTDRLRIIPKVRLPAGWRFWLGTSNLEKHKPIGDISGSHAGQIARLAPLNW
ncbi:hypothetical protein ACPOL_3064 [Acidisarcina polymorpha]|uniref:Uncharacterized protein n=1 Tax=Acidisarcina polymorpha TaxID=2211140 RepID=A0A2Z5FZP5_9BACT|nr:hypothetical protein ACPOL_3064 [Acidisarcina polymorpha]